VHSTTRANRGAARAAESGRPQGRWRLLAALGWSYRDAFAFSVAVIACGAILVNVLLMQTGQHPAPLFKSDFVASPPPAAKESPVANRPAARPPEVTTVKVEPVARSGADIVADIQRELNRRGYYDGVVDGRYGPRTVAAIRDFELGAGMKPSSEPSEALLQAIRRSGPKPPRQTTTASTGQPPAGQAPARVAAPAVRPDAIATVLAPSKRVLAVQRALADYGYGQIKPTGIVDAETQVAIEKFERERRLPVTGQASDRVVRELAAIIGRPLE
jgi:peptidoglycan hydrolase-like protein with peptidoglycan-binding domain